MTVTTTVNVSTALLSSSSIAFIRPIRLTLSCSLIRPNTQLYTTFDGQDVSRYVTQTNVTVPKLGANVISDSNGLVTAFFDIPGMTFTTGTKTFKFDELPPGSILAIGQITGSATAEFVSTGIKKLYQTTQTTTNVDTVIQIINQEIHYPAPAPQRNYDPLAETFFTYGSKDGMFITSIDLFFKTKDVTQPVWIEIRETIAGTPIDTLVQPYAISYVNGSSVQTSDNALTATNFKFNKLVYLRPDQDYCFVVQARSNKFNLWTSKMGEVSNETGKIVFDQPYSGSMFLSENNQTWTPSQTEDIKFVMYKAAFNTAVGGNLVFNMTANPLIVPCEQFYTFYNSGYVYIGFTFKHGLVNGDRIKISADPLGIYNGVSGAALNASDGTGSFIVTDVLSENVIGFKVTTKVSGVDTPVAFSVSDYITTGNRVTDVTVKSGGQGYTSVPTVIISAPNSGTQATAHAIIINGVVTDVVIDNSGTGYSSVPSVSFSGGGGSGVLAIATNNDRFTVYTNRSYHLINPSINTFAPNNTDISANLATTLGYYDDGNLTQYDIGKSYPVNLSGITSFDNNLIIASSYNEAARMGGRKSASLNVTLNTSNPDVSPLIDISSSKMYMANYLVNNQHPSGKDIISGMPYSSTEVVTSTNTRGSVSTVTILSGGSGTGYSSVPTVEFTGTGSGAMAHCTILNGSITSIILDSPGSGYTVPPRIRFIGGGGSGASAVATITAYNSELGVDTGSARGRYLTNQTQLATLSSGIQVYATAYSNSQSSFEIYIRATLASSGLDHKKQPWQLLSCDTTRNKSGNPGDFKEYKFYANGLSTFDVFSLKIVLRTTTPWQPPIISDYRAIVLAA